MIHHTCMSTGSCLLQPVLHPTKLGDSAGLLVGQKVFAIGNPFGLDHTLTSGIISGTGREISSGNTGRPIQARHTLPLHPSATCNFCCMHQKWSMHRSVACMIIIIDVAESCQTFELACCGKAPLAGFLSSIHVTQ